MRVLAISGSLRDASNSTALLRALREEAPEGVEVDLWDGLKSIPPYDQDDDVVPAPAAVAAFRELVSAVRRGLLRDPGVQLVGPRRAEECARLGLPPSRDQPVPQQARRGDQLERRCLRRRLGGRRAPQGARRDGLPSDRSRARRRPRAREARRPRAARRPGGPGRASRGARRAPAETAPAELAA